MENILSFDDSSRVFTGAQIKAWITHQLENNTSHAKEASKMRPYMNISDKVKYQIVKGEKRFELVRCK